jgi:hypothetical protein
MACFQLELDKTLTFGDCSPFKLFVAAHYLNLKKRIFQGTANK